jgi:phosphoribosylformylglycinamidine (FGAM) synthase-like enzyme
VPDADLTVTPDLAEAGNILLIVGDTDVEFAGSHLDKVRGEPKQPGVAPAPVPDAPATYRRLHAAIRAGLVESCHDVSEGGLAVAIAEMCIAGRLGATIDHLPHDDRTTALFAESSGRLVVEVQPRRVDAFVKVMDGRALVLGTVNDASILQIVGVEPIAVQHLADAFNSHAQPEGHT